MHVRMKCKVFRHKKPVQRKKFDEINHLLSSLYRRVLLTYLFDPARAVCQDAQKKATEEKRRSGEKMNAKAQYCRDDHDQNAQKAF